MGRSRAGAGVRAAVAATATLAALAGAGPAAAARPSRADTALLVLPRSQLGAAAKGLKIELSSGWTDNQRAADDSYDPSDTAAGIARMGRLYGFTLVYGDPAQEPLRRQSGLDEVGTSVDVFKTAAQARAYSRKTIADVVRLQGQSLQGITIAQVSRFPAPGLPDGRLLRLTLALGTARLFGTYVDFRVGNVLCEAVVTRGDGIAADRPVLGLARALQRRVAAALARGASGSPPALPRPQGAAGQPKGGPNLAKLALAASQAPTGSTVVGQRYERSENAVASYTREFRAGSSSGLGAIKSDIALERSRDEARGHLYVLRSIFSGPDAAKTVTGAFLGGLGIPIDDVRLDSRGAAGVGDESFEIAVSFTPRGQSRVRLLLVYFRVGRVFATLVVTGRPATLTTARGTTLAGAVARNVARGGPPSRGHGLVA